MDELQKIVQEKIYKTEYSSIPESMKDNIKNSKNYEELKEIITCISNNNDIKLNELAQSTNQTPDTIKN